jgi:RNA polymerase sigma-70 factor (ECF subfamily)
MGDAADDFQLLLQRIRLGDDAALGELARCYEPEVRLTARVLLGRALRCHLDSVDLVQSVHHTLLLGLRHNKFVIANPQQLVGLTVTLVRRKIARHWRKLKRQRRTEEIETTEMGSGGEAGLLGTLPSTEADPATTAENSDLMAQVGHHLDEKDRQLVELRLQGCSTAEAARRLGLDADVLRVRLSRLRRRLRDSRLFAGWL